MDAEPSLDSGMPTGTFDAVIVGGGPAGLSTAVSLGRACRSVLVLDCSRPSRSGWAQTNHNYLGFPDGVTIRDLVDRGRRQAERFGACFRSSEVTDLARDGEMFVVRTPGDTYRARAVVLATGVTDRWPEFPGYEDYIGRSLHWCLVCDGFEMRGQRVLVVGNDDHAAEMAAQLTRFAASVALLTNAAHPAFSDAAHGNLRRHGIEVVVGRLVGARPRALGEFAAVLLAGGGELETDHVFGAQGAVPNADLARALGVTLTDEGYIKVDTEAKTSVPNVYAAGDVTRLFSHQVATAVHEGATAAASLSHTLFQQDEPCQSQT